MDTKLCPRCSRDLPVASFGKNRAKKDGLQNYCKDCRHARHLQDRPKNLERCRRWQRENQEYVKERDRQKYLENPEPAKARARKRRQEKPEECKEADRRYYRAMDPDRRHFSAVKARAKKREQGFFLSFEEMSVLMSVEQCPVCDVTMERGPRGSMTNKSIDRINPAGPYSIENCACICYRCNMLKGNGTWEEHLHLAGWIKEALEERRRLYPEGP